MDIKSFIMSHNKIYHVSLRNIGEKKRYYVIRRHPLGAGFFSNYIYVLSHVMYAQSKGWIPVVDMKRYQTLYNEKEVINGTSNAWEYYFLQPAGVALDTAYKSHNYVLSDYSLHKEYIPYIENDDSYIVDKERMERASATVSECMIPVVELNTEIQTLFSKYFKGRHILGVHYRGTDKHNYNAGHYISPELEKYIEETERLLSDYKVDGIFLCTDEKSAIEAFSQKFPGKVFWNDAYRAESDSTQGLHLENVEGESAPRNLHKYLLGKEVVIDTYMLSMCDFLIHAHSNVTNAAIIMKNDNFIERRLIKLG